MKFRLEVLVDASPETIWKLMDKKDGPGIPIIDDVSERREPHFLAGSYESRSGSAIVVNHFEAIGDGQTRWSIYGNHSFKGIYRILSPFYAGSVRKHSEEAMNNFKLFAETAAAQSAT